MTDLSYFKPAFQSRLESKNFTMCIMGKWDLSCLALWAYLAKHFAFIKVLTRHVKKKTVILLTINRDTDAMNIFLHSIVLSEVTVVVKGESHNYPPGSSHVWEFSCFRGKKESNNTIILSFIIQNNIQKQGDCRIFNTLASGEPKNSITLNNIAGNMLFSEMYPKWMLSL